MSLRYTTSPEAELAVRISRACGDRRSPAIDSRVMSRIDGLSSVFPLRLARAYAPESVSAATPAPARRGGGVPVAIDRVDFAANAPSVSATRRSAAIEGLIAARVSVPVSFNEGDRLAASAVSTARSTGASLPFYVHPTDKNSAATAINVGRILDITA